MSTKEEMFAYAKKGCEKMGACNVLISLGGDGALLLTEHGEQMQLDAPKGELQNAVGAGDSMVAGFLAGYMEHAPYEEAFQMAVAAGSASAFSEHLATRAGRLSRYCLAFWIHIRYNKNNNNGKVRK